MSQIDIPAQKEFLWHQMKGDLTSLVPWFEDQDTLLCPTCCRRIHFDDFSVEHILPKQAVAMDPLDVRENISRNERSGLTLLCRKPLIYKEKQVPGSGCNSWKGKHYDPYLKQLLNADLKNSHIYTRHQIALYSVGYLGLFRQFGYQVALSPAGLISRAQFFSPDGFVRDMPLNCQMVLSGAPITAFSEENRTYWGEPFKIEIDRDTAMIILRNMSFRVPISRDPKEPLAKIIPYAPSKYIFRPDFKTAFD